MSFQYSVLKHEREKESIDTFVVDLLHGLLCYTISIGFYK